MIYHVILNGTDESPFPKGWGVEINPFPQIAKAEFDVAERQLAECGRRGTTPERIRKLLANFHPEFREMIVRHYKPGVIVHLDVDLGDALDEVA